MSRTIFAPKLNRRDFLEMGAPTAAAGVLCGVQERPTLLFSRVGQESLARARFRTKLCDLLGIEYPILQAGMSGIAGPELAAAVSMAGGLGILAGTLVPPDELRQRIRQLRALTDRPFGVNLVLHSELQSPRDVSRIPEQLVRTVQTTLNKFRQRLGLPATLARPANTPDWLGASFEVILEERVPVWSIGLGNPTKEAVRRCRERGIKVIAMVATVEDARAVAASGVDAIVAQGSEAGGHRSTWTKRDSREAACVGGLALVPQVADAVRLPVIAAGGVMDGRGLLAALALGAEGVLIGTRFIATRESTAPPCHKKAIIQRSSDSTTVTDVFTGMYARALRNRFTEEYAESGSPVLPPFTHYNAAADILNASARQDNGDYMSMYCGQGVGMARDMPGAGDVVRNIAREAALTMDGLSQRIRRV